MQSLDELIEGPEDMVFDDKPDDLDLIMKKVTGWAAVIAVPTATTGCYGQNVPYPGAGRTWGFWTPTLTIALVGGGLYTLFKRRDRL